ncbi:hypothetical protein BRN17_02470, partial [Xanthomonas oryzae pv. oryzae]
MRTSDCIHQDAADNTSARTTGRALIRFVSRSEQHDGEWRIADRFDRAGSVAKIAQAAHQCCMMQC